MGPGNPLLLSRGRGWLLPHQVFLCRGHNWRCLEIWVTPGEELQQQLPCQLPAGQFDSGHGSIWTMVTYLLLVFPRTEAYF